jgi:hypothetical protein
MDWIGLAQDKNQKRTPVSLLMNLLVFVKCLEALE